MNLIVMTYLFRNSPTFSGKSKVKELNLRRLLPALVEIPSGALKLEWISPVVLPEFITTQSKLFK